MISGYRVRFTGLGHRVYAGVDRKSPRGSTAPAREGHYSLRDRRKRSAVWRCGPANSGSYQGRRRAPCETWYHPGWPSGRYILAEARSARRCPGGGRADVSSLRISPTLQVLLALITRMSISRAVPSQRGRPIVSRSCTVDISTLRSNAFLSSRTLLCIDEARNRCAKDLYSLYGPFPVGWPRWRTGLLTLQFAAPINCVVIAIVSWSSCRECVSPDRWSSLRLWRMLRASFVSCILARFGNYSCLSPSKRTNIMVWNTRGLSSYKQVVSSS